MKLKDFIRLFKDFDGDLEVEVADGYECRFYSTDNIEVNIFNDGKRKTIDIGIGGCEVSEGEVHDS